MTFNEAYEKLAGILDGCLACNVFSISADKNRLKVFYDAGYEAAQNQYKDKIDKVLNHLNLSPVERHTVEILIKEDIL